MLLDFDAIAAGYKDRHPPTLNTNHVAEMLGSTPEVVRSRVAGAEMPAYRWWENFRYFNDSTDFWETFQPSGGAAGTDNGWGRDAIQEFRDHQMLVPCPVSLAMLTASQGRGWQGRTTKAHQEMRRGGGRRQRRQLAAVNAANVAGRGTRNRPGPGMR